MPLAFSTGCCSPRQRASPYRAEPSLRRHACNTVVWSRPPNASPISGKLCVVSSFASAIAICRGRAIERLRRFDNKSATRILKYSATVFWMFSTVTSLSCNASTSRSASLANSSVIGWPVKRAFASTRRNAPSSSRTFERIRCAMKNATSSGSASRFGRGFADQDRDARLELRRLDRDREPPAEPRLQTLLEARHFLRIAVAGQDDLPLTF